MNPIVFHIASGDAFFSGIGAILAAVILENWAAVQSSNFASRTARLGTLVGAILMGLSSNPSTLFCVMAVFASAVSRSIWTSQRNTIYWIAIAALVSQLGWQASYLRTKHLDIENFTHLLVIGDSIAAGMNEPQASKWPSIVADKSNLKLVDAARPGATTTDILPLVLRTASVRNATTTVVVLEIGGNDVLQGRAVESYRNGLESILAMLRRQGMDTIYMFELPLPPFHERFSFWQRSLARKYNVQLIPKREFLSVLAAHDSTSDSLHLSLSGHQRMASNLIRYLTRYQH
jgi:acyl-CoA thioesterase-1